MCAGDLLWKRSLCDNRHDQQQFNLSTHYKTNVHIMQQRPVVHWVLQDRVVYVDLTVLQQVHLCIYLHRIDSAHHVEH